LTEAILEPTIEELSNQGRAVFLGSRYRQAIAAGEPRRVSRVIIAGLTVLGLGLRLAVYAGRRPLWLDEASLALNIASRSPASLAGTLDYHQFAPMPFLWAEWLVTRSVGVSEYSLRAVPLAAGVLLLLVIWPVARQLLGELPAVVVTALASISLPLIYYSSEVKQYGVDACTTVVLLALVLSVVRHAESSKAWRRLLVGGMLGLWISQPSIFILAGSGAALIAEPRVRAAPRWRRDVALTLGVWSSAFFILYVLTYRQGTADPYLRQYWEGTFLLPGAPDIVHRVLRAARYTLVEPVFRPVSANWFAAAYALGGLFLVGLYAAVRRHGLSAALLLTVPYGAVGVASALGKYPIADRLLLFLSPLLFMVYGAAIGILVDQLPLRARRGATAIVVGLLFAWRARSVFEFTTHPPLISGDTRGVISQIEQGNQGEPVYLYVEGVPLWMFYTTDWHAPDRQRLRWAAHSQAAAQANQGKNGDGSSEDSLIRGFRGRREVIGLPSGVEALAGVAPEDLPAHPDSGWAQAEVRRILHAGVGRDAWLFVSSASDAELQALLAAVARRGGRIEWQRGNGTVAYRVRFRSAKDSVSTPHISRGPQGHSALPPLADVFRNHPGR
jgi:hypothetical protein